MHLRFQALLLAALGLFLWPALVSGQEEGNKAYVPQDEIVSSMLRKASEQEAAGQWEEAVESYFRVENYLAENEEKGSGRLLFPVTPDRYVGVRTVLRRRLADLPAEALELYRASRDPEARVLLERGREAPDGPHLSRLIERYLLTSYGQEALGLRVERALERGAFGQALRLLRLEKRVFDEVPPRRELQRLVCLARLGLVEEAAALKKRLGESSATVGSRPLAELSGRVPVREPRGSDDWVTEGGDPAQVRRPERLLWPGERVASVKIPGGPMTEPLIKRFEERRIDVPLVYRPVAVGRTVVLNDRGGVLALDLRTGGVRWRYDPNWSNLRSRLENQSFVPAVSGGRVFAHLRRVREPRWPQPLDPDKPEDVEPILVRESHLVCLDRETGRLLWDARENERFRELTQDAHLVTSPVAANGRVYVTVVRRKGDYQATVVGLNAADGSVAFETFVCSGFPENWLLLGATPPLLAVREGILYFGSNLGVMAALDGQSGALLWASKYTVYPPELQRELVLRNGRWELSPPRVFGGAIYWTPQDSHDCLAVDRETGRPLWQFSGDETRLLVGIDDERVYLVGRSAVALDRDTGRLVWRTRLPDPLRGTGIVTGEGVLLSTREGLVSLAREDGRILRRGAWVEPGGEAGALLQARDRFVTVGPDRVNIYRSIETSRDPVATVVKAEVALRGGQFERAVRLLLPEIGKATGDEKVRMQTVGLRAARHWAERDAAARVDALRAAVKLAPSGEKELLARRDLADALLEKGNVSAAVTELHQLRMLHYDRRLRLDDVREVLVGIWAGARIGELIEEHGRTVYADQEKAAMALLEDATKSGTAEGYLTLIKYYPESRFAVRAHLELSRFYKNNGLQEEAGRVLVRLQHRHADHPEAHQWLVDARAAFESAGRYGAARRALERLRTTYGDRMLRADGEQVSGAEYATRVLAGPLYDWPEEGIGDLEPGEFVELWQTETNLVDKRQSFLDVQGQVPGEILFLADSDAVEARWIETGLLLWRKELGRNFLQQAAVVGSQVVLPLKKRIVALDLWTGIERWSYDPPAGEHPEPVSGVTAGGGIVAVVLRRREVLVLDAETGTPRWREKFEGQVDEDLLLLEEELVVPIESPAALHGRRLKSGRRSFEWEAGAGNVRLSKAPIGRKDGFIVVLGNRVLKLSRAGAREWERPFNYWLRSVKAHPDSRFVAIRPYSGPRNPDLLVLDARTGRVALERSSEGKKEPIRGLTVGEKAVYVTSGTYVKSKVEAVNPLTGTTSWVWEGPTGQRFAELMAAGRHLIVPTAYNAGKAAVYLISKTNGEARLISAFDGRRIVSTALRRGWIFTSTDRGLLAFGHFDRPRLEEEVQVLQEAFERRPNEDLLASRLADRYYKLGRLDQAVAVLNAGLLAEGVTNLSRQRLQRQLDAYKEARIAQAQPVMEIERLPEPPEIDGELMDWWPRYQSVRLGEPRHVSPVQGAGKVAYNWTGDEDLSGTLYMAYDAKYFYFALDVDDGILRPYHSDESFWRGDCLLLGLDPRNDGGKSFKRDDTLLSLALTVPKQKSPEEEEEEEKRRPAGKFFVKRKDDMSGAVYEGRIPWETFARNGASVDPSKGPNSGFTFGFNVVLTDDDGERDKMTDSERSRKVLRWTPGIILHTDKDKLWSGFMPEYFGKVKCK